MELFINLFRSSPKLFLINVKVVWMTTCAWELAYSAPEGGMERHGNLTKVSGLWRRQI